MPPSGRPEYSRSRQLLAIFAICGFAIVATAAFGGVWWAMNRGRLHADADANSDGAADAAADVQPVSAESSVPRLVADRGFLSSSACQECHPRQHDSWRSTFHRTMTQLATPETVNAPFHNVRLESRGDTWELSRRGDEFVATLTATDGTSASNAPPPQVANPVVMTTGSHHMQGFWIPHEAGNDLVQLPFYYHFAEKRWIPREDVFLRPPDKDPQLAQWSITCIKCHSVAGIPGGIPTVDRLNTQVAELGIACEACHGPGEEHVQLRKAATARSDYSGGHIEGDSIVNPSALSSKKQSEICGQCHSEFMPADPMSFWTRGLPYRAGDDLARSHLVVSQHSDAYQQFPDKFRHTFWNDGTCRVGGDEYNALIESPCYRRGELSCLSCHSMHDSDPNDMLKENAHSDRACVQCHAEARFVDQIEQHTHHPAESSGSRCYNCHMPYTSYALMTPLRSHRVTSPRVEPIVHGAQPNACNLCHLDQTLGWSSERLTAWYNSPSPALSDEEQNVAASLLWLLRGDAMQRALSAWHLGWAPARDASGDDWQSPFLSQLLKDPYVGVRYQAVTALRNMPGLNDWQGDFLDTADAREKAQSAVIEAWRRQGPARTEGDRRAILLDNSGDLRQAEINALLNRRDDRYVRIPE